MGLNKERVEGRQRDFDASGQDANDGGPPEDLPQTELKRRLLHCHQAIAFRAFEEGNLGGRCIASEGGESSCTQSAAFIVLSGPSSSRQATSKTPMSTEDTMHRLAVAGAVVSCLLNCSVALSGEPADALERCRVAWNEFLSKNCPAGQSEQAIRRAMEKKHRDTAIMRANDETYRVLFLVDDFHQIEFFFDQNASLLFTPNIEPKSEWLRFPDGQVLIIPNESESRLKAKAEVAAIKHVAERLRLSSNELWASARRAAKPHTWEVVVLRDSLEVDTPTYILEVTDNGRMTERRRSSARSE